MHSIQPADVFCLEHMVFLKNRKFYVKVQIYNISLKNSVTKLAVSSCAIPAIDRAGGSNLLLTGFWILVPGCSPSSTYCALSWRVCSENELMT